jgi:uncharacterized membrane protein YciS (DUF1049 family)
MDFQIPWGLLVLIIVIAITYMDNKVRNRKIEKRNKMKAAQKEIIDNLIKQNEQEEN